MWYFIIGAVVVWVVYRHNQKKQPELLLTVAMHVDNSGWEETKKQKARSLVKLKKFFQPAQDNEEAIQKGRDTINEFVTNHHQSPNELATQFQQLNLTNDPLKKEAVLRKYLVPDSNGVSLKTLKETKLWEIYITLMPRQRLESEKKYKTLRRQSLR